MIPIYNNNSPFTYVFSLFMGDDSHLMEKVVYLGLSGIFVHITQTQGSVQREEIVIFSVQLQIKVR